MDAYPDLSSSDFVSTLSQMKQAGANLIWLGHNNPVGVDPNAREVALSYAVYTAATNPGDPQYAAAQSIVAAQWRALDAARSVGMKLVLPIGYQTQMGAAWDAADAHEMLETISEARTASFRARGDWNTPNRSDVPAPDRRDRPKSHTFVCLS